MQNSTFFQDDLWEQKVLESAFSGFQIAKKPKFLQPWCHLREILCLWQTSCFELLGEWNVGATWRLELMVALLVPTPADRERNANKL